MANGGGNLGDLVLYGLGQLVLGQATDFQQGYQYPCENRIGIFIIIADAVEGLLSDTRSEQHKNALGGIDFLQAVAAAQSFSAFHLEGVVATRVEHGKNRLGFLVMDPVNQGR